MSGRPEPRGRGLAVLILLWALPVAAAIGLRPLLPVDETRYLSVAWEMWNMGELLVPHLNGQPYSDKPPLLLWLVLGGWKVLGVSEVWARLVSPLAALAALALSAGLGRSLWPGDPQLVRRAPLLLAGSLLWTLYQTVVLFDLLLTVFVLLGWLGVVCAARGRAAAGFGLLATGTGLGILTKGPVVLVFLLPPALLAPWWGRGTAFPSRYYAGVAAAVLCGCGLALAWALPAAQAGGEAYARAILWWQTAGRVVSSFAHRRPVWWYLPLVPLALLPWSLWPSLWRGLARLGARRDDPGLRFAAAAILPAFAVLSLVSGKQVHYLLPLLPLVTLVLALALPPAATAVARAIALATAGLVVIVHLALASWLGSRYDVAPFARCLAAAEARGLTLAHAGRYQGEFHFLGRLRRPFLVIDPATVPAWLEAHPEGRVVARRTGTGRAAGECGLVLGEGEAIWLEAAPVQPLPLAR